MCTLSWRLGQNGYDVFFNRDEQRSRTRASAPQIFSFRAFSCAANGDTQIHAILPTDPQGGGTWLAVNEFGWTFALLNYYQGRIPKGRLRSRGKIVKDLARLECRSEIDEYFESFPLQKVAPFSLLVFPPIHSPLQKNLSTLDDARTRGDEVHMIRWTGKELRFLKQAPPLFSSAVKFDEVSSSRLAYVESEFHKRSCETHMDKKNANTSKKNTGVTVLDYLNLHKSHTPSKSAFSICMHREDAKTVSFSHIRVDEHHATFTYTDGAPCETEANAPVVLALKKSEEN